MYLVRSTSGHDFHHHASFGCINREKTRERYFAYAKAHINNGIAIYRKYISNPNNQIMLNEHGIVVPVDILCETFLKRNSTELPIYVDIAPSIDQNMRDIINKYPQMDWRLDHKIPYFTFLEIFKDGNISKYPNYITEEILSSSNGAAQYVCEHGTDFINTDNARIIQSCWDAISCNNYISIAYILEHKHLPWNWRFVSMRHDITMAIARANDVNWDWREIYRYAKITGDDVIQAHKENKMKDLFEIISCNKYLIRRHKRLLGIFSNESWAWSSDVICTNISMPLLRKYPEICKHLDWYRTSQLSYCITAGEMLENMAKNTTLKWSVIAIVQRTDFTAQLALKYENIVDKYIKNGFNNWFWYSVETVEQARHFIKLTRNGQPELSGSWHINCKIIDELAEEFTWDWAYVAKNPTITPAFIKKYQHKLSEANLIDNAFYYYRDYTLYKQWTDICYRRKLVAEEFNYLNSRVAHYIDWR